MKRLLLCACLLGAANAAAGADFSSWTGQELFTRFCSSCHGADGRGDGPVTPALRTAPPDLTRIAARHGGTFPDDAVYRAIDGRDIVIAHGPREMPVWGHELWREQGAEVSAGLKTQAAIERLVEWLRSIQQPRRPDDPAGLRVR